jgi:putative nucleotidyltransferase with HDIG domain
MDLLEALEDPETLPPPSKAAGSLRDRLEELVEGGFLDLPILPGIAAEVIVLTSREDCDMRKLADVITRDQAMAAHVLRMANSAAYRGTSKVVSLRQAMTRLGLSQLRQIAFVISCQNRIFRVNERQEEVERLFQHSFATALYAQEIARMRRANVEEAFLGGLLHDVGRPVLLQAIVDMSSATPYPETEVQDSVDALHAYVGGELVTQWGLSERLAESITHHHHPAAAPGGPIPALMIRLADDLAHRLDREDPPKLEMHPALAPLSLYPDDLKRLLDLQEWVQSETQAMR